MDSSMKKLILLLFLIPNLLMADSSLTKKEKQKYSKEFAEACYLKQKKQSANKSFSNKQIYSYCLCISNEILNAPNAKEVIIGMGNGDLPPTYYSNLILASARYCGKQAN